MRLPLSLVAVAALSACSHRVALYCDENTPCDDPARPFCDLAGEFPASDGIGRTCIPNPFDAGPDAPAPDAAAPCSPREWAPEFVDQEGNVGFFVDIAVDREGGVHIVYQRDGPLARYAYRRAGAATWETRTLESGGFYAQVVSAGDRVDVVHGTLSTLRHLSRRLDESTFAKQDVITAVAYDISLAADDAGDLHVAYLNTSEGGKSPAYQRGDGTTWGQPEQVMPGFNGGFTAIGVHAGTVHLAFNVQAATRYGRRSTEGDWSTDLIQADSEDADYPALAADGTGAHIVYYDAGELKYARALPAGGFDRATIDQVGDELLATPGAAVDLAGGLHVTYRDETGGRLRYATRGPSSTTFLAETIEDAAVGKFSAVAVDPSGGIHVAYIDETGDDVKYAYLCR